MICLFNFRSYFLLSHTPEFSLASHPQSLQTISSICSQDTFQNLSSIYHLHELPTDINLHNILTFLQYLHQNSISVKVIKNYLSSISTMASLYNLDHSAISHPLTTRYIRGLSLYSPFCPTPRGVFDVPTLYLISQQCDNLSDPILFRATFLTAFYSFLRVSNIAPHSLRQFDPNKHFLRQNLIFAPPGAHLILKWCKTMQDNKSHDVIQIPQVDNYWLCPDIILPCGVQKKWASYPNGHHVSGSKTYYITFVHLLLLNATANANC